MNLATSELLKTVDVGANGVHVEGDVLAKCQKTILGIAEDVIEVCEKENIWYELGGGTALGAIRHKGFIPWDDDIDLNIRGKDLYTLRLNVEKYYPNKYIFQDYTDPEYGLPMGRVMLKNSIYRDRESVNSENCGFFIDLFPIENVPDNAILRKIHGNLCMIFGGLLSCRKFYKNRRFLMSLAEKNPHIARTVNTKINIGRMIAVLPLSVWAKMTNNVYAMCKNDSSLNVTIPSGRKHYYQGMSKRNILMETSPVEFEGHKWMVAADYDSYLKRLYGDNYMEIPPESKREHHVLLELRFPE